MLLLRPSIGIIVFLATTTASAHAQACIGRPGYTGGPSSFGIVASADGEIGRYGVEGTASSSDGFVRVTGLTLRDRRRGRSGQAVFVSAGTHLNGPTPRSLHLCPLLTLGYEHGPNFTTAGMTVSRASWRGEVGMSASRTLLAMSGLTVDVLGSAGIAYHLREENRGGRVVSTLQTQSVFGGGVAASVRKAWAFGVTASQPVRSLAGDVVITMHVARRPF